MDELVGRTALAGETLGILIFEISVKKSEVRGESGGSSAFPIRMVAPNTWK